MSVQVEKLENGMAKLTIGASAERLEEALQNAFTKNKNKISVPGFRKGKVPPSDDRKDVWACDLL